MIDLHIHSHFSIDARDTPAEICVSALEKGVTVLCVTDHIDLDPSEKGFGFYNRSTCFKALDAVSREYSGRLKILKGIEFGESHLFPEELKETGEAGYDMILGSLHNISGVFVSDPKLAAEKDAMEFSRLYFEETLKMVRAGGFDVLAHFDFPKRYRKMEYPAELIDEILHALIERKIALEVNTSTYRHGIPGPCPTANIIRKYIELGGHMLTIGSDAHKASDITSGFQETMAELGPLTRYLGYFEKRKFKPLKELD